MSSATNFQSPLEFVHLQCLWDDLLEGNHTNGDGLEVNATGIKALLGETYGLIWEPLKYLFKVLHSAPHVNFSDERALMVYAMISGMTMVAIMVVQKEITFRDNAKMSGKLGRTCDYLAFAVVLIAIVYFANIVFTGPSTWNVQAVAELAVLLGFYHSTKTVVCASIVYEIEPEDRME